MKHLKLMSLLLLLSAFCAFKTNAATEGPNDTDSLLQSFSTAAASPYGGGGSNPHFIPVDSANKMLESYLNSINADTDTSGNIQSFIMDAAALREYLADNSIKKVKIMLAHTLNYINAGNAGVNCGYRSGKLTIVIAGFDADNNYIFTPDNKVPDSAVPCPANCPSVGTASDMTLH